MPVWPSGVAASDPAARAWLNVQDPASSKEETACSVRPTLTARTVLVPPTVAVIRPAPEPVREATVKEPRPSSRTSKSVRS